MKAEGYIVEFIDGRLREYEGVTNIKWGDSVIFLDGKTEEGTVSVASIAREHVLLVQRKSERT